MHMQAAKRVSTTVKFIVTFSVDVRLVHSNKFVGSISQWGSRSCMHYTLNTELTSAHEYSINWE